MRNVVLAHEVDFEGWRTAARRLALDGIPPEDALFSVGAPADLFAAAGSDEAAPSPAASSSAATAAAPFTVPRPLVELAQTVIQAREPERFSLLYGLVWRTVRGEKRLVEDVADPAVHRAIRLAQSVRRDTHKMRAFVRFREVTEPDANGDPVSRYVSWFEPEHFIVEANAAFFVRRFATMVFSILTPYRSVHWTGEEVRFAPGADPSEVPDDDALERYWRAYYGAIFNPARLKVSAMMSEMPRKYWRNLPEAAAIPELIRGAARRTDAMLEAPAMPPRNARLPTPPADDGPDLLGAAAGSAGVPAPRQADPPVAVVEEEQGAPMLAALARAAADCRRCPLWEPATQTVFGEGPETARMMMVGEQPGDQEDLVGRPFVGPAGQLLDRAIKEAGIDRATVYVTNAVKHFKFEPRGKRRIHAKPDTTEIVACSGWLAEERKAVRPALVVMLGATAARAVLGRPVTIGRERSRPIALDGNTQGLVTVHPSFLLRLPDEDAKKREYAAFVADLKQARALLDG
ncbi:UdgX family uracil-DNA binding protein [Rhizosaccharibacter radicis]|uniref:Type-4 uracil-DNA glycosylase n=1 Tax=Rhizosaccharibacter radicis TaxID=2782605 RepID=A0ABT1W0G4_9PROT|nr:UdgX family uracil-DNA binding protein [Acetobacteraceae bacterium KSS12]